MNSISIVRPDDWHLHLRDRPFLDAVVADSARQFARAIIMPNLTPPVRSCAEALAYRERILAALPTGSAFEPLMTLYLTDHTAVDDIREAAASSWIHGAKLYPAGATTNSAAGVTDLRRLDRVFDAMQEQGLPLQVHGESIAPGVDIFDREKVFIDAHLVRLRADFPQLRIVFEHITTGDAVDYVLAADSGLAATITPHHLLINRSHIFQGGIRPHLYCLPVAKREHHRQALVAAATGGDARFFAGTDSAPHARGAKESACGCAGIYSAHNALELYAEAFDANGGFEHFETFMSRNGPAFYHLPVNRETVTLRKQSWRVPDSLPFGDAELVPFRAGEQLAWKMHDND